MELRIVPRPVSRVEPELILKTGPQTATKLTARSADTRDEEIGFMSRNYRRSESSDFAHRAAICESESERVEKNNYILMYGITPHSTSPRSFSEPQRKVIDERDDDDTKESRSPASGHVSVAKGVFTKTPLLPARAPPHVGAHEHAQFAYNETANLRSEIATSPNRNHRGSHAKFMLIRFSRCRRPFSFLELAHKQKNKHSPRRGPDTRQPGEKANTTSEGGRARSACAAGTGGALRLLQPK
ncbi:hypothetical protein EVAR_10872_1 [Eumeta japonica]|uniref:Uncharacterized protein n=1 Tax=Eumeta variegata TaxID=151549 RepID=A0A4C1UST9_EUMVA|nr:hypothetical protein EVAR_10872_1 [Eumeta japonica]